MYLHRSTSKKFFDCLLNLIKYYYYQQLLIINEDYLKLFDSNYSVILSK